MCFSQAAGPLIARDEFREAIFWKDWGSVEDKEWVVFSIAFELAVNIRFPPHVSSALDLMHEEERRTKSSFEERVVVESATTGTGETAVSGDIWEERV